MVTARNTRADVVSTAGRMFADKGYHGTSMRDLGRELGLLGSSLYSHIDSKEDLLVEVVDEGARLFLDSAVRAREAGGPPEEVLRRLIAGHVEVVLDHQDVVRTYLNEARMLEPGHREKVVESRDRYEQVFRDVIEEGIASGRFREDANSKISTIFILSILNALERWYQPGGEMSREAIVGEIHRSAVAHLS